MAIEIKSQDNLFLLQLAKSGDAEAFAKLYDLYINKIYNFIYYKTLNKEVAEDIASIVFMKSWKNIQQCKLDSFAAWLYAIARHSVADYYRKEKNLVDIDDCWDLADEDDFLGRIDSDLKIENIRKVMLTLKSHDREIVIMRFWQDLSFKEIADRLDKQEGAVKMSFSRAINRLRLQIPSALVILLLGVAK